MQKLVTVNALSGTTPGTANLFIQEGYYLQSVQCKSPAPCPGYVWLEYFYDRNETTYGEVLTHFWVKNTTGYDSHPTIVVNKQFESELSSVVFHVLNQSATDNTYVFVVTFGLLPSHQVSHYDIEEHRGLWTFAQQYEASAVGGGTLIVAITPAAGTWIDLSILIAVASFTNAAHITTVRINDENNTSIRYVSALAGTSSILTGPAFHVLAADTTATTAAQGLSDTKIHYPNQLRIYTGDTLAQNDSITIHCQAYLKSLAPTVGLAGTNTPAIVAAYDDYDKVV